MDEAKESLATLLDSSQMIFWLWLTRATTIGQIKGMYNGDRSRKECWLTTVSVAVCIGQPSLRREEFESHVHQIVYVSATPGDYEMEQTDTVIEQIIRPTGLWSWGRSASTMGQIDDLLGKSMPVLKKRMNAPYHNLDQENGRRLDRLLQGNGHQGQDMHSDIKTLERIEIIRDLRLGVFDVLVGLISFVKGLTYLK